MKSPMLLSNDKFDLKDADYSNSYISIKRDGIRGEFYNTGILNRSFKTLRNVRIQEYFREIWSVLPDGIILEAEIYKDRFPCRKMGGICNSLDTEVPEGTKMYIFGIYDSDLTFEERLSKIFQIEELLPVSNKYEIVTQNKVKNYDETIEFYNQCVKNGFEGSVLMNGNSKYKNGRIRVKQKIGYKIKPSKQTDLEIIGVTERMENTNESEINELGRSFKRNTVGNKKPTGIAGTFICKYKDTETRVTVSGSEESRREIWSNRNDYIGCYVVIESMDYGEMNKLRQPTMIDIKLKVEK